MFDKELQELPLAVQSKNLLFASQTLMHGYSPLDFSVFASFESFPSSIPVRPGLGVNSPMGSVSRLGGINKLQILDKDALDTYFGAKSGFSTPNIPLGAGLSGNSVVEGLSSAAYNALVNQAFGLGSDAVGARDPFSCVTDVLYGGSGSSSTSSSRISNVARYLPSKVVSLPPNSGLYLPWIEFRSALFLASGAKSFVHHFDRSKSFSLPFQPVAFYEFNTASGVVGYFISERFEICQLTSQFKIQENNVESSFSVSLVTAGKDFIVGFDKDKICFRIFSVEKGEVEDLNFDPLYTNDLKRVNGMTLMQTIFGPTLITVDDSSSISFFSIQERGNIDLMNETGYSLQHIYTSRDANDVDIVTICALPTKFRFSTTNDELVDNVFSVVAVCQNRKSGAVSLQIIDLRNLLNSHDSAILFTKVDELSSLEKIFNVQVLEGSVRTHRDTLSGFVLRVLSEKSISEVHISLPYEQGINYLLSMGTDIFISSNRRVVLENLARLNMFDRNRLEFISENKELSMLLDLLWANKLTSLIIRYITIAPRNELGDRVYLLHDASNVFDWINEKYSNLRRDFKYFSKSLYDYSVLSSEERLEKIEVVLKYTEDFTSILHLVEALQTRPQDVNEKERLSCFCGMVEKSISKLRVVDWLLGNGYIPYNPEQANYFYDKEVMMAHFNQNFIVPFINRRVSFNTETLQCDVNRVEQPHFINLLISKSSNPSLNYPPGNIHEDILSLFDDEGDEMKSRSKVVEETHFNHLVFVYLLNHYQIASNNANDHLARYTQQFKISDDWLYLVSAFLKLDVGEDAEELLHSRGPYHEWHENILSALCFQEPLANLYLEMHADVDIDPFLKLDCYLGRDLLFHALELERSFTDEVKRKMLFSDMLAHCIRSKNLVTLLTYQLDSLEEEFLISFLQRYNMVDILVSYFIVQNRFEDAAKLCSISTTEYANNAITNVLKVLPSLQRNQILGFSSNLHLSSALQSSVPSFSTPPIRGLKEEATNALPSEEMVDSNFV